MNFRWLYKQAKNKRTKLVIQELEKKLKLLKKKDSAIINVEQKFPLRLGEHNIWLNEDNSITSLKTYTEIFKDKDHNKLPTFPSKNDLIIIDLGANEGFYTLMVKKLAPKSRVIAVEPNPSAFKTLKKNIEANKLENVIAVNKAVSSKNGKIIFEIVKGRTTVGALKVYRKYRKRYKLEKISVSSVTLEKLCNTYKIDNIDLLKIDIEGSELEILKSSKNVLPRVRKVVIEYHKAQRTMKGIIKLMLEMNFKIALIDKKKYYGDIYFLKDE
jgi:FkbM family methyltransferase